MGERRHGLEDAGERRHGLKRAGERRHGLKREELCHDKQENCHIL